MTNDSARDTLNNTAQQRRQQHAELQLPGTPTPTTTAAATTAGPGPTGDAADDAVMPSWNAPTLSASATADLEEAGGQKEEKTSSHIHNHTPLFLFLNEGDFILKAPRHHHHHHHRGVLFTPPQ